MKSVKLTLGAVLIASLAFVASAEADKKKPKEQAADQYKKEYNEAKARCQKKYGNGGTMRVVKKGNEWWCYWRN